MEIVLNDINMSKEEGLYVEVVYSPQARVVECIQVDVSRLKANAEEKYAVQEVIAASHILKQYPELDMGALSIGVWGRRIKVSGFVQAGDRVEIYRPLSVDPKEARRLRYKKQGTIQTRCRPNAKEKGV